MAKVFGGGVYTIDDVLTSLAGNMEPGNDGQTITEVIDINELQAQAGGDYWLAVANAPNLVGGNFKFSTNGYLFAAVSAVFCKYTDSSNSWVTMGSALPGTTVYGGAYTFVLAYAYVAGSSAGTGIGGYSSTYSYNDANDFWTNKSDLSTNGTAYGNGGAFAIGGYGYAAGGALDSANTTEYSNVSQYNETSNNWVAKQFITVAAMHYGSFALQGYGYCVAGGVHAASVYNSSVYRYDDALNSWSSMGIGGSGRYVAMGSGGNGMSCGGWASVFYSEVDQYIAAANYSVIRNNLLNTTATGMYCALNGMGYLMGGSINGVWAAVSNVYQYHDTQFYTFPQPFKISSNKPNRIFVGTNIDSVATSLPIQVSVDNVNWVSGTSNNYLGSIASSLPFVSPANYSVSTAVANSTTATITTSSPHNFTIGQTVTVSGVNLENSNVTSASITSATQSGTTATLTTSGNHGFVAGNVVTISGVKSTVYYVINGGAGPTNYGALTVGLGASGTQFADNPAGFVVGTSVVVAVPIVCSTTIPVGSYSVTAVTPICTITNWSQSANSTSQTFTTSTAHGLVTNNVVIVYISSMTGNTVNIANLPIGGNDYQVTAYTTNTFTINSGYSHSASTITNNVAVGSVKDGFTIGGHTNSGVAWVNPGAFYGNCSAYNGTFTLTAGSGNTLSYTTTAGMPNASGAHGGSLNGSDLNGVMVRTSLNPIVSAIGTGGTTASITTLNNHGLVAGNVVTISGVGGVSLGQTIFQIASISMSSTTVTINTVLPTGYLTGMLFSITGFAGAYTGYNASYSVTTCSGTQITAGCVALGLGATNGVYTVTLLGGNSSYFNGTFTLLGGLGNTFTYTAGGGPGGLEPASGGTVSSGLGYNGTFTTISPTSGSTLTYTTPKAWLYSTSSGGNVNNLGNAYWLRVGLPASKGCSAGFGAVSATVSAGGSGYAVGNIIYLPVGVGQTASFYVATLSGSAVATVNPWTSGMYATIPTNPVAVTGGSGSSCTLTVTWSPSPSPSMPYWTTNVITNSMQSGQTGWSQNGFGYATVTSSSIWIKYNDAASLTTSFGTGDTVGTTFNYRSACCLGGYGYALGGYNYQNSSSITKYNDSLAIATVSATSALQAKYFGSVFALNGNAYYCNGANNYWKGITAASSVGTLATITVPTHGLLAGTTSNIVIAGMTPSGYNGTFTVTYVSATQLTYTTIGSNIGAGTIFGTLTTANGAVPATANTVGMSSVVQYNPVTLASTSVASNPTAMYNAAGAFVLNGFGYQCNGFAYPSSTSYTLYSTTSQYNDSSNTWTAKANNLITGSTGLYQGNALSNLFGLGYWVAGSRNASTSCVYAYSDASNLWITRPNIPTMDISNVSPAFTLNNTGCIGYSNNVYSYRNADNYAKVAVTLRVDENVSVSNQKTTVFGGGSIASDDRAASVGSGSQNVEDDNALVNTKVVNVDYNEMAGDYWVAKTPFSINGAYGQQSTYGFSLNGYGFSVGGNNSYGTFSSVYAYDDTANAWSTRLNIPFSIQNHCAFSLNGYGYIKSGQDGSGAYLFNTIQYSDTLNSWLSVASIVGLQLPAGFTLNGFGYVVVGYTGSAFVSSSYQYNDAVNLWGSKQGYPISVVGPSSFVAPNNTSAWVLGGYNATISRCSFINAYNDSLNIWVAKISTAEQSSGMGWATEKGYLAGGATNGGNVSSLTQFTPETGAYASKSAMSSGVLYGANSFSLNNFGYVFSGNNLGTGVNSAYVSYFSQYVDAALFNVSGRFHKSNKPPKDIYVGTSLNSNTNGPSLPVQISSDDGTNWVSISSNSDSYNLKKRLPSGAVDNGVRLDLSNSLLGTVPATGYWKSVGNNPTARWSVVGFELKGLGYAYSGYISTFTSQMDQYSDATAAWTTITPTGAIARNAAQSFSLSDAAYVFSGIVSGTTTLTGELSKFNPITGFTAMTTTGTVANRFSGGADSVNGLGYVVQGFDTNQTAMSSASSYNPNTRVWTTLAVVGLPTVGSCHAWGLNGFLYAIGGSTANNVAGATNTNYRYNDASTTWIAKTVMTTVRTTFATFVLNSRGYFVGGYNNTSGNVGSDVSSYVDATDVWIAQPVAPTARAEIPAGFSLNGSGYRSLGYSSGGQSDTAQFVEGVRSYKVRVGLPRGNVNAGGEYWVNRGNYVTAAGTPMGFNLNGFGYSCGGYITVSVSNVGQWNDSTNILTFMQGLPNPACQSSSFAVRGYGYIIHGYGSGYNFMSNVQQYDEYANVWTSKTSGGRQAQLLEECFSLNGLCYMAGGANATTSFSNINIYNPILDTWSIPSAIMSTGTHWGSGFSLNGFGYICGGFNSVNFINFCTQWNDSAQTFVSRGLLPYAYVAPGCSGFIVNGAGCISGNFGNTNVVNTPGSSTYQYNDSTNVWQTKNSMPLNIFGGATWSLNGSGYFAAGASVAWTTLYSSVLQYTSCENYVRLGVTLRITE